MVGFRAAGWTCFAAAVLSFGIALIGLRGIGVIGRKPESVMVESEIQLTAPQQSPDANLKSVASQIAQDREVGEIHK
jgi:hypothetical protein